LKEHFDEFEGMDVDGIQKEAMIGTWSDAEKASHKNSACPATHGKLLHDVGARI